MLSIVIECGACELCLTLKNNMSVDDCVSVVALWRNLRMYDVMII